MTDWSERYGESMIEKFLKYVDCQFVCFFDKFGTNKLIFPIMLFLIIICIYKIIG